MTTFTKNFALPIPDFDQKPWQGLFSQFANIIDAVLGKYILVSNFQGVWLNSTQYTVGMKVVDPTNGTIYNALVTHVSSGSPATFASDRLQFSTYWASYTFSVQFKGTWVGPGTSYGIGDFVASGNQFAVSLVNQTSGATFAGDVAQGFWQILIDGQAILTTAQTQANNAATSATAAAASALSATNSATAAATSAATLPAPGGNALKLVKVNAAATGFVPSSIIEDASGNIGFGMVPVNFIDITQNSATPAIVKLLNNTLAVGAQAKFSLGNGTSVANFGLTSTSFTPSGIFTADGAYVVGAGTGGLTLGTTVNRSVFVAVNNAVVGEFKATGLTITGNLSASNMVKMYATNNGMSIPSGPVTTLTSWATGFDVTGGFVPSTGLFTPTATGYFLVTAGLVYPSALNAAGTILTLGIAVAGATRLQCDVIVDNTLSFNGITISGLIQVNAGQTISLAASQTSGSAQTLSASASSFFTITQVP